VPFFIAWAVQTLKYGIPPEQKEVFKNPRSWPLLLAGGVGNYMAFSSYGFAMGSCRHFSTVAILAAMQPFLMLLWDRVVDDASLGFDGVLGLMGGGLGAALMLVDEGFQSPLGLLMCFVCSFFVALYLKTNATIRRVLDFTTLMSLNFGCGLILATMGTFAVDGTTFDDSVDSIFYAFRDSYTLLVTLALTATYFIGISSFVLCAKYIPVLVIAVVVALEPELSIVFAVQSGKEPAPSLCMGTGIILITAAKVSLAISAVVKSSPQEVSPPCSPRQAIRAQTR
jgi:hypothetical protein